MHLPSPPDSVVCFGTFELNLEARELRKRGLPVKLTEQSFRLLAALVESSGETYTRGEIRSKLWPKDADIDFEHSLNKAIHELREALGDSAIDPRFIETIQGKGYRFAPIVHKRADKRIERRNVNPKTLAVLPFIFSSGAADAAFIAAQLTATLINAVSLDTNVGVLAYNAVRNYEHAGKSVPTIGGELGVTHVVLGEILQRNMEAIVQVEFIDTSNGMLLRGMHLTKNTPELADHIEQVAAELVTMIVSALKVGLRPKHKNVGRPLVPLADQSRPRMRTRVLSKAFVL